MLVDVNMKKKMLIDFSFVDKLGRSLGIKMCPFKDRELTEILTDDLIGDLDSLLFDNIWIPLVTNFDNLLPKDFSNSIKRGYEKEQ